MKINALIVAMCLLLVNACKPTEPVKPEEDKGVDLVIRFRPTFLGNDLSWTTQYITAANDSIIFDKLKFLMSDFTLEKNNGDILVLPDAYAYISLKDGRDSVILKNVPKGDYKSIRFQVGLDSPVNHGDPTKWQLGEHPLSPALNEMHWGWAGGYIFNVVEGTYKNNGSNGGFSFHIASDKYARTYGFIYDYSLAKNSRFVFEVKTDKYFNNVMNFSLKTDGAFSHSGDMDPLMDKFILNASGVFDLESFQ